MDGNALSYCSQINGLDVLLWLGAAALYHVLYRRPAQAQAAADRAVEHGASAPAEARRDLPVIVRRPASPRRIYKVARRDASLRREVLRSRWCKADIAPAPAAAGELRPAGNNGPRLAA